MPSSVGCLLGEDIAGGLEKHFKYFLHILKPRAGYSIVTFFLF